MTDSTAYHSCSHAEQRCTYELCMAINNTTCLSYTDYARRESSQFHYPRTQHTSFLRQPHAACLDLLRFVTLLMDRHTFRLFFFFLNDPAPPDISPLPLHAPLPI